MSRAEGTRSLQSSRVSKQQSCHLSCWPKKRASTCPSFSLRALAGQKGNPLSLAHTKGWGWHWSQQKELTAHCTNTWHKRTNILGEKRYSKGIGNRSKKKTLWDWFLETAHSRNTGWANHMGTLVSKTSNHNNSEQEIYSADPHLNRNGSVCMHYLKMTKGRN